MKEFGICVEYFLVSYIRQIFCLPRVLLFAMRILMEKCFTIKSHKCLILAEVLDILLKISF